MSLACGFGDEGLALGEGVGFRKHRLAQTPVGSAGPVMTVDARSRAVNQSPWCNYKGEASHGVIMSGQPDTHKASCHRERLIIVFTIHVEGVGHGVLGHAVLHNRLHL